MSDITFRLLERHQRVDRELRGEQSRRIPDPFKLIRLKKLKLALKDRISALARLRLR